MKLLDRIVAVSKKVYDIRFDEEITLEDLGVSAGYSKYHAAKIIKELTGKTPFEVIRSLRLTKAARTP